MKCTKITHEIQNVLQILIAQYPLLADAIQVIHADAARIMLVGGAVRDLLLHRSVQDIDIEVHGVSLDRLATILAQFGVVDCVGKTFGVLRVHGLDVDWSVPRSDTAGRKPAVTIDPYMSCEQAFRRRDLAINAMGIDLVTYELIDPFNGMHDLACKILRTPDPAFFVEDPLRFLRVMQFMGRFDFVPDVQLNELCKNMSLADISRERIEEEFEKLFMQSTRPSLGLRWLADIGRLHDILPEVAALQGVAQRADWHPEGDVFEHTMQALDAAARICYTSYDDTLILRYAALCHDLGKAVTTQKIDGIWRSSGHAKAGIALAKKLLKRITHKKELIGKVLTLVEYHMHPLQLLSCHASIGAYKRLAYHIAPIPMRLLIDLFCADRQGRNPHTACPLQTRDHEVVLFEQQVVHANVLMHQEPPVLLGRDLVDVVEAGPAMGMLLKRAYMIQIEENISDKVELKKRILQDR